MSRTRQSTVGRFFAALFLTGIASPVFGGDITGVVSDATARGSLPGAVVTIVENGRSATTDSGGRFSFNGLPEGTYTLSVRYLGYDTKNETVQVPASGDVPVSVRLGEDVVVLDAFKVEGYREGRSRALQQKQTQNNISDIISADAIGNLPDRNVAEAVARLPGVNMSLEQGEGRYVSIRGIEPNLNQVMIDGAIAAAPGGTRLGRAVPLDTLGAGQVSQIEVVKSVTPDLDANSLGGTLKITTASPFDRRGRFFSGSLTGNHNESADKQNLEGRLSYSDLFGPDKKWGVGTTVSFDQRDYSNHWLQTGWNLRTINGANIYLPQTLEIKPEHGSQTRQGGSLTLEFRPDEDTQFYLRPNFSMTKKNERTEEVLLNVDNAANRVTLNPGSTTAGQFAAAGYRPERRNFLTQREQSLFSIAAGFKKTFGEFTLEPMLTYSAAKEDRVYDKVLAWRPSAGVSGPVNFDISAFDFVRWDVDYNLDSPSRYALRRTRDDWGIVDEDTITAKADLTWKPDTLFGGNGFLKGGYKYTQRARITDLESRRLVPASGTNFTLGQVGVLPGVPVYDGRYTSGFLIDPAAGWAHVAANSSLYTPDPVDSAANSIEDDYDIDEYIYAAYAMASVTYDRLTVLGGVRWEQTDATIRAVEARFAGTTLLGRFPKSGTTSYDKFFPNLQGVFRFNERLLLRAALTQTIGRPAYEDARPLANFRYDALGSAALNPAFPFSGSVTVGNPNLGPYDSRNYDLSLEWYPQGRGVISIAAFRKEVDDPIYGFAETRQNVTYSGIPLETLNVTSRLNADSAEITGVEFNVYQPFTFFPSPFDGFGIDANYTRISSEVKVPTRPGEDFSFFRQPGAIANFTLFYERNRFSGRVAWNWADEQIYTLGGALLNDIYLLEREQVDVQMRYKLNENFSITAAVRNVTKEPERFSYGVKSLMRSSRLLDREFKLGIEYTY